MKMNHDTQRLIGALSEYLDNSDRFSSAISIDQQVMFSEFWPEVDESEICNIEIPLEFFTRKYKVRLKRGKCAFTVHLSPFSKAELDRELIRNFYLGNAILEMINTSNKAGAKVHEGVLSRDEVFGPLRIGENFTFPVDRYTVDVNVIFNGSFLYRAVKDETLLDSVVYSLSQILGKETIKQNTVINVSMQDMESINKNSSMIPKMTFPFSFYLNGHTVTAVCVYPDGTHIVCLISPMSNTGEMK